MRAQSAIVLCAIAVLSLTACGQTESSTPTTGTESTPAASAPASPAASAPASPAATTPGYSQLLEVVAQTQSAVEAKDFAKAQTEFNGFEGVWSKVEDGIKENAKDSYRSIEDDLDQVTAALKASQSDKAIAALKTLQGHIQSIPKF